MRTLTVILASLLLVALTASWAAADPLPQIINDGSPVRHKRQFKAQGSVHDRPWGKDYSVSGGYKKTFNNGQTSVDIGGYKNWGSSGSDKGGYVNLSHKFKG